MLFLLAVFMVLHAIEAQTSSTWEITSYIMPQNIDDGYIMLEEAVSSIHCAMHCNMTTGCSHFLFVPSSSKCYGYGSVNAKVGSNTTSIPVYSKDTDLGQAGTCLEGYTIYPDIGNGWCVKYNTGPVLTWNDAKSACEQDGTRLAVLNDLQKLDAVKKTISTSFIISLWWIGGYHDGQGWVWMTGENYDSASMGFNVKRNQNANCLTYFTMNANGLDDFGCSNLVSFLCDHDL